MLKIAWEFLGKNGEQIVTILALVVAVGGFWIQRRHNRLSVRPHLLEFTDKQHHNKRVVFLLQNNGVGPALIKSYELLLDNKKKSDGSTYNIEELAKELLKGIKCKSRRTQLGDDYSMPANTSVPVFDIVLDDAEPSSIDDIVKLFNRADLVVKYESFYKEKFVFDTRKHPYTVDSGN